MFVNEIAISTAVKVKELSTSIFNKVARRFSRSPFFRRSRKVFLSGLFIWLIVAAAGFGIYRSAATRANDDFYNQGLAAVQALAAKCGPFVLENDILALNVQIREIESLKSVEQAAIMNHQNTVLAETLSGIAPGAVFEPLKSQKRIRSINGVTITAYKLPDDTQAIGFVNPITFSDVEIGHVYLGLSAGNLYRNLRRWRWIYAGVMVLLTALVTAIVLLTDRAAKRKAIRLEHDLQNRDRIGPYHLIQKVAQGGMAELFLADYVREDGFRKKVAVKRILPQLSEDPEFIRMFIREARIAALLQHPNIVQIFDYGKIDQVYFIAMEYIDGKNLAELLAAMSGGLPLEPAVFILLRACKGLVYSHTKKSDETGQPLDIIHRDISPQNLLISYEGEVKISDFGISKARSEQNLTQAGVIKGKMGYLAPEQALGRPADHRTDIYALGLVFYETLTGKRVHRFGTDIEALRMIPKIAIEPIKHRMPDIPDDLNRIVMKCLENQQDARYQSAAELYGDLTLFRRQHHITYEASDLAELLQRLFPQNTVAP